VHPSLSPVLADNDCTYFDRLSQLPPKGQPRLLFAGSPSIKPQHPSLALTDAILDDAVRTIILDIVTEEAGPYEEAFDEALMKAFLVDMVHEASEFCTSLVSHRHPRGVLSGFLSSRTSRSPPPPHFALYGCEPIYDQADRALLTRVFDGKPASETLVSFQAFSVTRLQMHSLSPRTWLNDQVINTFTAMCCAKTSGVVASLGSFFLTKLKSGGAESVKRWVTKLKLTPQTLRILVPVNVHSNHWALAVVNLERSWVEYYDSMFHHREVADSEHAMILLDFCNVMWPEVSWVPQNTISAVPQQSNGYDCGVFTCRFVHAFCNADTNFRPNHFEFSQEDMDHSRQMIIFNMMVIGTKK